MSDRIEPALSAEEWAAARAGHAVKLRDGSTVERAHAGDGGGLYVCDQRSDAAQLSAVELPALIALANDVLPDDDPRKITRELLQAIKTVAYAQKLDGHNDLEAEENAAHAFADALESLLPPESLKDA